jgi:hypothetical protein
MKIYFLTYGDKNFYLAKKHLMSLAAKSKYFDYCIDMGPADLEDYFINKYKDIFKVTRGGGYWIWKHNIISNLLNKINYGDIVVYCDAGASLNYSAKAKLNFQKYISILNDSEHSNLRMECEEGFIEKYYTTREIFNYFNLEPESKAGNSTQLQAGHMFFKKNNNSINYFNEYEILLDTNSEFITDAYNQSYQINGFCENRHDQSIFSLMSKTLGSEIIPNETEFRNRVSEQFDYPFLSVRSHSHGLKDYLKYFINPKKFTENTIYFD